MLLPGIGCCAVAAGTAGSAAVAVAVAALGTIRVRLLRVRSELGYDQSYSYQDR